MTRTQEALRRAQIACKSPIQQKVDQRPRCEDCGRVLLDQDYLAYWDGDTQLTRQQAQPRVCLPCAEEP